MNRAEFEIQCPVLSRASWDMFRDAGGSESFRDSYYATLDDSLAQLTHEDLMAAEVELASIETKDKDDYTTAIAGEFWDMLMLCSNNLEWVLTTLFGEGAQDKDEFMKTIEAERAKIPADYKFGTNSGF